MNIENKCYGDAILDNTNGICVKNNDYEGEPLTNNSMLTINFNATNVYLKENYKINIVIPYNNNEVSMIPLAAVKLSLNETKGSILKEKSKTVTILGEYYGDLSCTSSNTNVSTCSISGNILTITGKSTGASTITVRENKAGKTATYTASVYYPTLSISPTSANIIVNKSATATISGSNYGTLSCTSSNTNVSTCSISGKTLTITGKSAVGTSTITVKESTANVETKYTATIINPTLSITPTSGVITIGTNKTATISGSNYGTLSCTSSNASIAGCSISGTALTITGINIGTSIITVKGSIANLQANYTVSVAKNFYTVLLASETAYSDRAKSPYVSSSYGIDFMKPSSDTNGKGFYYTEQSKFYEDGKRIYYYRGDVDNNWVSLGGYLWRIVRTTSENGVKLIYAGDGQTDISGYINGGAKINANNLRDIYGPGYSYNPTGFTGVQTNSILKQTIDTWYQNWTITQSAVPNYLSPTAIYCNERTNGFDGSFYLYGAYARFVYLGYGTVEKHPTYVCPYANQSRYTVSTSTGNGYLQYPVATITIDEAVYAGLAGYSIDGGPIDASPNTYIIDNAKESGFRPETGWWTMTPYFYAYIGGGCNLFSIHNNGTGGATSTSTGGLAVRPLVSLKPCVGTTGGNGTKDNPYTLINMC